MPSNCKDFRFRFPIAEVLMRSLRSNLQAWFGVAKSALRRGVLPVRVGRAVKRWLEAEGACGKFTVITWQYWRCHFDDNRGQPTRQGKGQTSKNIYIYFGMGSAIRYHIDMICATSRVSGTDAQSSASYASRHPHTTDHYLTRQGECLKRYNCAGIAHDYVIRTSIWLVWNTH
jgi:hypothetical protein